LRILRTGSKKNELAAELSYWYGIDCSRMSADTQHGFKMNLKRIQAQDQIRNQRYDETNYNEVYGLYLVAYGDTKIAEDARTRSLQILAQRTRA
jgi:hypothetical protein